MDKDKEIDVEAAHGFSIHNRKQLEKSNMCGCFDCYVGSGSSFLRNKRKQKCLQSNVLKNNVKV